MSSYHIPVLLKEAVDELRIQKDQWYIDATAGGGGHTAEIVERGGQVIAIDQDANAIDELRKRFEMYDAVKIVHANFSELQKVWKESKVPEVSGVLFDLGVSSYQLGASGRGFSLRYDEPLDMRMNEQSSSLTAAMVLNQYPREQLIEIFEAFGEEVNAEIIANEVVRRRAEKPFQKTGELVELIESLHIKRGDIHPATKVFQALRMEINQEPDVLKKALVSASKIVRPGGRIVTISFHSIEDRIVKRSYQGFEQNGLGKILTKKPIIPSEDELRMNRRSRSAKMRVFEIV